MCTLLLGLLYGGGVCAELLLDHGVPQDHIIFVTFLVARFGGVIALRKAFPHVKIVCSAVDDHLRERWLEVLDIEGDGIRDPELSEEQTEGRKVWVIEPGMGHIGTLLLRRFRCG